MTSRPARRRPAASRRPLGFEPLEPRQLLHAAPLGAGDDDGVTPQAFGTFVPPPAVISPTNPVQQVRVIVLNFEPTVPSQGNQTLWQIFGWSDPRQLAAGFIADMESASGGAVDYQIVQWRDLNEFPIFTDGFRYTADQYVQNRQTNTGWVTSGADFYAIAQQQGLAPLVNGDVIDEIWLFGDHYFGLLGEAWMAGPQSFFVNGPSFPEFAVDRAVAGFGFSYERGVAEMVHNHGHRTENHLSRAYGGWNIANPVTPWDRFTANVAQTNRSTYGVGSVHYPFNGASDYDYVNTRTFDSYADDFVLNFPNQTYAAAPTSRAAWGDFNTGDWHRGYMKWFFGHMPRGDGVGPDGRANNWYKYINDFNAYRPNTGRPRDNEAILGAPPLTAAQAHYEFTLRYYDVQGVDAATLGDGDVLVTGPGGYSQLATLVEIGPERATTAGTARTVRYRVAGPGGGWDAADSGAYSVQLRTSQVRDAAGAFLPAVTLGSFQVNIAAAARLDVAALLAAGQATVVATPWDIGGPEAIFDASTASLYRTPNIDPAVVTLSFDQPQTLAGFRAMMAGGAYRWSVEAADSLADLDGKTGSYALLVPWTNASSEVFSTRTLPSLATARQVRLTAERLTGDNYVHINAWELLTPETTDAAPPAATLLAAPTAAPGARTTAFTVRYSDDGSIDAKTINFGDVRVTGPNGFVQTAALYALDVNANGPLREVEYFLAAPGGQWDSGDNGQYAIELVAGEVLDVAGKPAAPTTLGTLVVAIPPPETRPRIDLAELNAADWFAFAQGATAATSDDPARRTLGEASVRFDTTGGFDTYLRYEPARGVEWDLTAATQFQFDVYAQNANPPGFQESPIVRFTDADGDAMIFRYYRNGALHPLWNDARNVWRSHSINIKSTTQPATGWRGTAVGTPDWSRMASVQIHADTWDAGFTLWLDRMGFNLPVIAGDYTDDGRVDGSDFLAWQRALGSRNPAVDGDRNGIVDAGDLAVWRAGGTAAAAAPATATAAPPPSAVDALLAAGDVSAWFYRDEEPVRPRWRPWRPAR